MNIKLRKKIILVGDRVLISPEKENEQTAHGLYLPPGVREKEKVQSGIIVSVGPGYPVVNPNYLDQDAWSQQKKDPVKYIPLQAEEGDIALFLKDSAIEIQFENETYLIIQQASILALVRREHITTFSDK